MQNKTTTNQEEELMLAEVQRREEEAQKLYDALSSVEKEQIQKVIDLGREYLQRGQSKPNENRSEQLVEKIFESYGSQLGNHIVKMMFDQEVAKQAG